MLHMHTLIAWACYVNDKAASGAGRLCLGLLHKICLLQMQSAQHAKPSLTFIQSET